MPARVRLTEIQYALVEAVHDGKTSSMVDIGRACGVDNRKAGQMVGNAIRSDVLSVKYQPDSRQYDLATLKVTKRGEELFAATDAPKPASATSPKRPRRAKAPRPVEAPTVESAPEGDLESAISVTFDVSEIARLEAMHAELGALIATLKASPPLGPDGAYLVRLLGKLQAKG